MEQINKKAPVIGFVRYSQKIKFTDKETNVFEKKYFEYRFDIFKNITLKSFQEQSNMNFVLLLLHSETMPQEYKDRFNELAKANLFLHNLFIKDSSEGFDEGLRNSISYVSFKDDVAVTFRIDNDDAVPNNFIQNLNRFLKTDFYNFSISMPDICVIKRISDTSYMVEERCLPSSSIGLAYVTNRSNFKTVMDLGDHGCVNTKVPMVLLTGNLRSINGGGGG
ncbi:MAG: putative rhamnosyl transferase, partial [Spirochaetaceae bacterium]|nr:putative rhamnosyl transferase [Spirochaetaceae bacterium]